ncbi:MAG: hypothetical protein WCI49_09665, partial [Ferruginibacter sp.]
MKTTLLSISLLFVSVFGFSQHVYQFNGNFNDSTIGGPALVEVFDPSCAIAPSGTAGSYGTEVISTSLGISGTAKPVFLFNQNDGFSFPNTGNLIAGNYTIHILYRITNYLLGAFQYQKLIDFSNGLTDNGLYTKDNTGNLTGLTATLSHVTGLPGFPSATNFGAVLNAGQYYLITLVRNGTTKLLDIYIDGSIALSGYDDTAGYFASNGTDPIVFFRDDVNTSLGYFPCESGSGAVRYISLSNTTSTATQVNNFFTNLVSRVLPVNLTAFNAQKNGNSGLLQWQTATEINAAYYNVERSYDGINFTAISKVNAKGQASNSYTFNDAAGLSSTNTYYRLKIVDNNGNFKYSSVVRLANGQGIKVSVFPNPASEVVTVSGLKANDNIKLL